VETSFSQLTLFFSMISALDGLTVPSSIVHFHLSGIVVGMMAITNLCFLGFASAAVIKTSNMLLNGSMWTAVDGWQKGRGSLAGRTLTPTLVVWSAILPAWSFATTGTTYLPNATLGELVKGTAGMNRFNVAEADPFAGIFSEFCENDQTNLPVPSSGTHWFLTTSWQHDALSVTAPAKLFTASTVMVEVALCDPDVNGPIVIPGVSPGDAARRIVGVQPASKTPRAAAEQANMSDLIV
jgi:hypothetical protein